MLQFPQFQFKWKCVFFREFANAMRMADVCGGCQHNRIRKVILILNLSPYFGSAFEIFFLACRLPLRDSTHFDEFFVLILWHNKIIQMMIK